VFALEASNSSAYRFGETAGAVHRLVMNQFRAD
jgi:hypothetical protein